jgi:hypothetical protein
VFEVSFPCYIYLCMPRAPFLLFLLSRVLASKTIYNLRGAITTTTSNSKTS